MIPFQFKERLKELKKETFKGGALLAYRIGGNIRVSDEGEPPGTGGKPILGRIDKKELTDTLVKSVYEKNNFLLNYGKSFTHV